MDPQLRREAVRFLREWLPREVRSVYRRLIAADPEDWHKHPHFSSGFFVESVLRGNGLTEETLGVEDLEMIWAPLLAQALQEEVLPDAGEER